MRFSHRNIFLLCWIQGRTIWKTINVLPTFLCTTEGSKEHEIADCVTMLLLKFSAFHSCSVTLYLFLKDKILTLSLSMDSGLNCSLWGRWKWKCSSWNRWKPPKRLQFLKLWCPKLDKPSAADTQDTCSEQQKSKCKSLSCSIRQPISHTLSDNNGGTAQSFFFDNRKSMFSSLHFLPDWDLILVL